MTVTFKLDGTEFIALNGGPHFTFTEAISFVVNCKTQREVDTGSGFPKAEKKDAAGGLRTNMTFPGASFRILSGNFLQIRTQRSPKGS